MARVKLSTSPSSSQKVHFPTKLNGFTLINCITNYFTLLLRTWNLGRAHEAAPQTRSRGASHCGCRHPAGGVEKGARWAETDWQGLISDSLPCRK